MYMQMGDVKLIVLDTDKGRSGAGNHSLHLSPPKIFSNQAMEGKDSFRKTEIVDGTITHCQSQSNSGNLDHTVT